MKITEEKVWLKYYDKDVIGKELPKYTAYSYLKKVNKMYAREEKIKG